MVPLVFFTSTLFLQLTLRLEGKPWASDTRQMKLHCHNICLDTQSFLNSLWRKRLEVSSVWHIKDLWLFICCQIGRQGEKNQTCPAVQHHTTKGKWTFIDDPPTRAHSGFPNLWMLLHSSVCIWGSAMRQMCLRKTTLRTSCNWRWWREKP